jgi:hypothetical protein
MTGADFINQIAPFIIKFAPSYHIAVVSPIIAQAVLESSHGTSELAVNATNFFGIKYREGRCPTANGTYIKIGSEQNADGSYKSEPMLWCKFPSMEACVQGYFDFINNSNYANLKGVSDPETYLKNIKADNYASSLDYVSKVMNVIRKYDLTQYDKEVDRMSNSPLISYTKISPNKTSPRNHVIDTITIHCMAGNLSVENCGAAFAKASRKASSNYGIGTDGRIALYVDEADRSWCSSNAANDNRAITIEVANDGGAETGWHVSDKSLNALIDLLVDICKRNDIKALKWQANKALIGQVDKQNMTVHRWFAAKACPGDYLYNLHYEIANRVNERLGKTPVSGTEAPKTSKTIYRVRKSVNDSKTQIGAYKTLANAKKQADANPGYFVFDKDGIKIYPIAKEQPKPVTPSFQPYKVEVTVSNLRIRKSAGTDTAIVGMCPKGIYTITEEKSGQGASKWGKLKSGVGWISLDYAKKC